MTPLNVISCLSNCCDSLYLSTLKFCCCLLGRKTVCWCDSCWPNLENVLFVIEMCFSVVLYFWNVFLLHSIIASALEWQHVLLMPSVAVQNTQFYTVSLSYWLKKNKVKKVIKFSVTTTLFVLLILFPLHWVGFIAFEIFLRLTTLQMGSREIFHQESIQVLNFREKWNQVQKVQIWHVQW